MLANIYYFVDERGHKPVEEFIRALPKKERAKIFLVHAIKKKTDKIPDEDLNLCLKRKKQVEGYCRLEKIEL